MKPAYFDYHRARDMEDGIAVLQDHDGMAKVMAGGQSLVPMLNLRLTPASLLIDITDVEELKASGQDGGSVTLGACVTHAAIEDGRVPDPSGGLMPRIARNIAYRAVRNRGTIGGSAVLADPSAEWIVALLALDATFLAASASGSLSIAATDFFLGAYDTALPEASILTAVRIPKISGSARGGFYKVCRKVGEFASSLAVVIADKERGICRASLGGTSGVPLRLAGVEDFLSENDSWRNEAFENVRAAAHGDLVSSGRNFNADALHLHATVVTRAVQEAVS